MAVNYFNKFPKVLFDVDNDGSFSVQVDITKTVDINTIDEDKITYYTFHEIQDGERPDNLSYNLYGTAQYYWTFFIVNDSLKAGLNNAWPLNSYAFEAMMINEYDDYSAITFDPILHESLDNNGQLSLDIANRMQSDFSFVPLIPKNNLLTPIDDQDQYLPYLRLVPSINQGDVQPTAKILKYDSSTGQLVIYDIKNSTRENFINQTIFKLIWVNPYSYDETAQIQSAEYIANEALKSRYVAAAIAYFEPIDQFYYPGRLADNNPGSEPRYKNEPNQPPPEERYVFDKKYLKVANTNSNVYSWPLYRNATAQYTLTQTVDIGGESITTILPVSLYDILKSDPVLNGTVGRISFYEKEEQSNSSKRNIKVIRPDAIRNFSKNYFDLLNR
jgi:hypothetical protein